MPQSETSYADRLQRARSIVNATKGFSPAFKPAESSLAPAAMETFVKSVEAANLAIATAMADWKETTSLRVITVAEIKKSVMRAHSRVKSKTAWAHHAPAVKALADKIRGARFAKPKLPAESTTPATPTRESGDLSYADIKSHLEQFNTAIKKITGYDTDAPEEITHASLLALEGKLLTSNEQVSSQSQILASARSTRADLYDGPTGLKTKLKAIKESAKSQYGSTSTQYQQIKPIRV